MTEKAPKYSEEVMRWYRRVLMELRRDGFEPTLSEAAFLRQIIEECFNSLDGLRKLLNEKIIKNGDGLDVRVEILERFFQYYYGVSYINHSKGFKSNYREQARCELYAFLQRFREEKELI